MKNKNMQIKNKKQIISISLSVIVSVFLVSLAVYAATTIGSNITTGGTLSVTGAASFSTASTTGNFWLGNQTADDDDYLYMDASSTEYIMWDDSADQFVFSNGVSIPSATTTDSLYIGGIASTTGAVYVGMLSAAGDDYLYFDANENLESLMWDDSPGMFTVSDDLNVEGVASSTSGFRINDHFIIGSTGIATTTENFSVGDGSSSATTTIEIGDTDTAGCLKIRDADADAWSYFYASDGVLIGATADNCDK